MKQIKSLRGIPDMHAGGKGETEDEVGGGRRSNKDKYSGGKKKRRNQGQFFRCKRWVGENDVAAFPSSPDPKV